MPTYSALVATVHHLLVHHRIDLSAVATALEIPLATIRRLTSPATAPATLAAWESLMASIGATVHLFYAGERYPVALPVLNRKRIQEVHERMVERSCAARPMGPASNKDLVSREILTLRRSVETTIAHALPPGTHHSTSIFEPAAVMIAGVAVTATLGRSFDTLELVTGVPGIIHQQLCASDEQRPMAILQTVLAVLGIVVVVDSTMAQSQWIIGTAVPTPAAFRKVVNQHTGTTRGAPSHEHLPLGESQVFAAIQGEKALIPTLLTTARTAGIPASTLNHWERRQRDPILEALETMTAALGGSIALDGRISCRLAPVRPTAERLEQAFRQTCSSYRWSVGRATGLTGDALMKEVARRVESTRSRVLEYMPTLPPITAGSLVEWIRGRVTALRAAGSGSVLELALISGLNRSIIGRILQDAERLDASYRALFTTMNVTLNVHDQGAAVSLSKGQFTAA